MITSEYGAPLCMEHVVHLSLGTGPWTKAGAREWLSAAKAVHDARALYDRASEFVAPGEDYTPFKWIGGSPGWNSNDEHERFEYLKSYLYKFNRSKKPKKPGEKRWNPNAWYLRAKKKKEGRQ